MIAVAVFAPLLALHDPTDHLLPSQTRSHRVSFFPLGTDSLGRDMYSRLLYGARVSLPNGPRGSGVSRFVCGVPMGH